MIKVIFILHKRNIYLNVYLRYCCPEDFDSFQAYLGELSTRCDSKNADAVYIVGDFNAGRSNHFWRSLTEFCSDNNFVILDERLLPINSFTYLSDSHNSTTWIDHCLLSASAQACRNPGGGGGIYPSNSLTVSPLIV